MITKPSSPRSVPRPLLLAALALLAAAALAIAGCGGDGSGDGDATAATPKATDFPAADGKTFAELTHDAEPSDLVVSPASQVFHPGKNRYGFGVFTVERDNVPDAQVALYASRPKGKALGPFPATAESLKTPGAFQSKTTTQDPDAATYVYRSEVELPGKGEWRIMAMIRGDDGSYTSTNVPSAIVGQAPKVPQPGDKVPSIHTPTADDVGGDVSKIDTRQPPDSMHDVDFADVVGKEPVVLLFATPALCTSRVCGPVVDIEEEVKNERPDDAAYIHMEIYEDNDANKGVRQQVSAFNLPTEPWLFVIGTDGKVSTAIEGAFSKQELDAALDKVS